MRTAKIVVTLHIVVFNLVPWGCRLPVIVAVESSLPSMVAALFNFFPRVSTGYLELTVCTATLTPDHEARSKPLRSVWTLESALVETVEVALEHSLSVIAAEAL